MSYNDQRNDDRYNSNRSYGNTNERFNNRISAPLNPVIAPAVEVKVAIDPTQRDLIAFKDKLFCVKLLGMQGGIAIVVTAEGVISMHKDCMTIATPTREFSEDLQNQEPIFARWEGQYVVVLGHRKAQEQFKSSGRMKGKLLSNPTLKRALVA